MDGLEVLAYAVASAISIGAIIVGAYAGVVTVWEKFRKR